MTLEPGRGLCLEEGVQYGLLRRLDGGQVERAQDAFTAEPRQRRVGFAELRNPQFPGGEGDGEVASCCCRCRTRS